MAARPVWSRKRLVSTYYDTADRALLRDGTVLRVRQAGDRRHIQTVKSAGDGASFLGRGEWEDAIAGASPDPHAAQSGRFLPPDIAPRLCPAFRTEIMRRSLRLEPEPGTRIEAAIDRGRIRAGDRTEPVCEIELELKDGSPTALYDAALKLLEAAPIRVEVRSKAERGYRLAAGGDAATAHFDGGELDPAESGEAVLHGVGRACVAQLLANEAAALAGDAEGVHQMRIALRRLRAILSAFGIMIPKERRAPFDADLRWLGDALAAARNLDVFTGELIGPARAAQIDGVFLERLGKAAERRRRRAYASARRAIRSPRYTALLLRLMRWFDDRLWRGRSDAANRLDAPIAVLAPALLDRRRRKAQKRSRNLADQSPKQRHKLRIALKKLRYTTELFASLYDPDEAKRFIRRLKHLQTRLGDANDVRVGRKLVAELAPSRGGKAEVAKVGNRMLDWHADRLAEAEPKLLKQVRELYRAPRFWPMPPSAPDQDATR